MDIRLVTAASSDLRPLQGPFQLPHSSTVWSYASEARSNFDLKSKVSSVGPLEIPEFPIDPLPSVLVSYAYLDKIRFTEWVLNANIREWVLDSGAFTAHGQGVSVDLEAYISRAQELRELDLGLVEIYSLDVIGDWRASLKNTEAMWSAGIEAIPCYHVGEPVDVLVSLARDYPKIALGGAVGYRAKLAWAEACFSKVWPKRIHGFGFGSAHDTLALPWDSIDASNWIYGPAAFGRWAVFGEMHISRPHGLHEHLRAEVEHYLALEWLANMKWRALWERVEEDL